MEIIPAIDIIDGQCVRLTQGDYDRKKVYDQDPVAVAKRFEALGIRRLHLVDLDGARSKKIINHAVLAAITRETALTIDFGGGIKSEADVTLALASGEQQITEGTLAVKNRTLVLEWMERYGTERIILGAEVKAGRIAVSGWREESAFDLFDFLDDYHRAGIRYVICTDIAKDGLLRGPAIELYRQIRQRFPELQLIASGGVTTLADLEALAALGCSGAIVGKALYEGTIPLKELTNFIASC